MKKSFFVFAFLLSAASSHACEDFKGKYKSSQAGDVYTIFQTGCESVLIKSEGSNEKILTDGAFRLKSEDNGVVVHMAASFVGETYLLLDSRIEYKIDMSEVPEDRLPKRLTFTYSLDGSGNLINVVNIYNQKGEVIFTQAVKDQRI